MAMYSAYFDESGHPDSAPFILVAGCVAEVEQWKHFEREWLEALRPFETNIFHATDFENGNAPFGSLREIGKREFLGSLISIIRRRIEKQFAHVMPMDVYNRLNEKYVFTECFGFPYPAAARMCMSGVIAWAEQHVIGSPIKYFFENGAKNKGQLEWMAQRDKIPAPIFLSKEQAVSLQAGDLIAWLLNRILTGAAEEWQLNLFEKLEEHSREWSEFREQVGDALAKWANIPIRNPQMRYKCKIIRTKGRLRPVVQYWRKVQREPKVDKQTLELPEALPPFSSTSDEEIAASPVLRMLASASPKFRR